MLPSFAVSFFSAFPIGFDLVIGTRSSGSSSTCSQQQIEHLYKPKVHALNDESAADPFFSMRKEKKHEKEWKDWKRMNEFECLRYRETQ